MTTKELLRKDLRLAQNCIESARRYAAGEYREHCKQYLLDAAKAIYAAVIKLEAKEGVRG